MAFNLDHAERISKQTFSDSSIQHYLGEACAEVRRLEAELATAWEGRDEFSHCPDAIRRELLGLADQSAKGHYMNAIFRTLRLVAIFTTAYRDVVNGEPPTFRKPADRLLAESDKGEVRPPMVHVSVSEPQVKATDSTLTTTDSEPVFLRSQSPVLFTEAERDEFARKVAIRAVGFADKDKEQQHDGEELVDSALVWVIANEEKEKRK